MTNHKPKLELTWIGKGEQPKLEPRILIEDPTKSYGDKNAENILIYGDNLLALKALEQDFSGAIKCIYIDPPYNTDQAFEEYDDSLEHSIWLNLMSARLRILRKLLRPEGSLFIQLNDEELCYCKVILDEIFGRNNFINQVSVKTKNTAGASGGGEDKRLKKNVEYLLIYARDYSVFQGFNDVSEEEDLFELIDDMEASGKSWKYTSVLLERGKFVEERTILDGSGDPILVKKYKGLKRTTIAKLMDGGLTRDNAYVANFDNIFSDTNAQTSIRARIIDEFKSLAEDELLVSSYIPKTGKDKGRRVEHYYLSPTIRRVIWLKDSSIKKKNSIVKLEKVGTYWYGFNWNNVNKEGKVVFTGGKKPEALVQRIFELATDEHDWVLDSFMGSGTTAATAHKMKRNWIGIELGDHCHSLCLPRMRIVVDGSDQSGISESQNWKGGGGFRYYYLAPSLLKQDSRGNWIISKEYNAAQLAAAMAKHEGFRFMPDETFYWKQGKSTEKDFIFTTTNFVSVEFIDTIHAEMKSDESLLICCTSFSKAADKYPNITIKKIPKMLLGRCEFGKEDYSLNIVNLPRENDEPDFVPTGPIASNKPKEKKKMDTATDDLFGGLKGGKK